MARDEFNNVKNENHDRGKTEFGKTPGSEFSHKKEWGFAKDGLNKNEHAHHNVSKKPTVRISKATTAQTAGKVTATVATAASTVAVVAISVATGITVAKGKPSCRFTEFHLYEDALEYCLILDDPSVSKDEEWQKDQWEYEKRGYEGDKESVSPNTFVLYIHNADYENSQPLWNGENWGYFEGLVPGQTYQITVKQNRIAGYTIYDESFSVPLTSSEESSEATSSEESYEPSSSEESSLEPSSEQTSSEQTSEEESSSSEESSEEESSTTEDTSSEESTLPESVFHGIEFGYADFEAKGFEVTLDYEDEAGHFDSALLTLLSNDLEHSQGFSLPFSHDSIFLSAETFEDGTLIDLEHETFAYRFSYLDQGEAMEASGTISFEDQQGRSSAFYGIQFDGEEGYPEMDFHTGEMNVTLDIDDYFGRYTEITLTFVVETAAGKEEVIAELAPTRDTQTLYFDPDTFPFEGDSYLYRLSYYDRIEGGNQVLEERAFTSFVDISPASFDGIVFSNVDFSEKTFAASLKLIDDIGRFHDFVLAFDGCSPYELTATGETQVLPLPKNGEEEIDLENKILGYTLSYYDGNKEKTTNGNFEFVDEVNPSSEFKGIAFDNEDAPSLNFATGVMEVTLDYVDYFGRFSSPVLTIKGAEEGNEVDVALSLTTQTQEITLGDASSFNPTNGPFTYTLTYHDYEEIMAIEGSFSSFTDTSTSQINGIDVDPVLSTDEGWYLPLNIDFIDEKGIYPCFEAELVFPEATIHITQGVTGGYLWAEKGWQYGYLATSDIPDSCYEEEGVLNLYIGDTGEDEPTPIYSKSLTLEKRTEPGIYHLNLSNYGIDAVDNSCFVVLSLIYNGTYIGSSDDTFQNVRLRIYYGENKDEVMDFSFPSLTDRTSSISIWFSSIVDSSASAEEIVERLSSPVDIAIAYEMEGKQEEVLCYEDYSFYVIPSD